MTSVLLSGGFNSGRLYSSSGQRIWWAQFSDGWLYFNDCDRMISGWIHREAPAEILKSPILPGWLMQKYDAHAYQIHCPDGHQPLRVPSDFDFGKNLRV